MKIGIFAKTFSRPTIEDLFVAIAGYEIYSAQFNLSCVGLETLPTNVPDALARRVIDAAEHAKVELSAKDRTTAFEPCAAGKGILDFDYYLRNLRQTGFPGPLIIHGLQEEEVAFSRDFLRRSLAL